MISSDTRLRVWASQLEANDFPPICAISGEPAETWIRLRARRPFLWALPFLFLLILCGIGLLVSVPLGYVLSDRVLGNVPVKAKYVRRTRLLIGVSAAIAGAGVILCLAGVGALAAGNYYLAIFAPLLLTIGILAVLVGVLGIETGFGLGWNPFVPRGRILRRNATDPDRIVELYYLHPGFVEAANRMYAERSARLPGAK